jgi:hypothetical protein
VSGLVRVKATSCYPELARRPSLFEQWTYAVLRGEAEMPVAKFAMRLIKRHHDYIGNQ